MDEAVEGLQELLWTGEVNGVAWGLHRALSAITVWQHAECSFWTAH